ncbi:MAG: branched-chain amino acid ABC transporter permease [Gammaproteobacteria bacterium]|nr:branched-chain amino acid ABC transporter permease [Gammaproteobacteria bacterium]
MFYRQAGVHHSNYKTDSALFPIPFDKWSIYTMLALGIFAPAIFGSFALTSYLLPWMIWAGAALSLNLLIGWAGQFHFGYAAVMSIGGYTAIHATLAGIPFEIALILAGLMSMIVGVIFGAAAMRVKGLYLALATLAMQFVVDWVLTHVPAIGGGASATLQAPDMTLLGFKITSEVGYYYVAFGWLLLVTIFLLNMRRTGFGRALVAVREKDYAASILGVNSFYFKSVAFAVSSFMGGVSGAILVFCFYHAVTPEQFTVNVSIQLLAMVIVGGLGSIIGSYFGAAFILLLPGALNSLVAYVSELLGLQIGIETLAHLPNLFYGILIIGFLLYEPLGLAKVYDNIRKYLMVWPFGYSKR